MAKKYNSQTGKWVEINVPGVDKPKATTPTSQPKQAASTPATPAKTTPAKTTPASAPASTPKTPKTPAKPVAKDKGNSHQGSEEKKAAVVEQKTREIEYDLEGTAELHPNRAWSNYITARDIVTFGGLGKNFYGNYFLSTVVHTINRSGYRMSVDVLRNSFVWQASSFTEDLASEINKIIQPKQEGTTNAPNNSSTSTSSQTYTVKKGDTLWAIAKRYYGDGNQYTKIVNANKGKISDPNVILVNQVLTIPK